MYSFLATDERTVRPAAGGSAAAVIDVAGDVLMSTGLSASGIVTRLAGDADALAGPRMARDPAARALVF